MHIINHKIILYFNVRMNILKQNIEKKENLKFNVLFTFFKVFMIFTRPNTASDSNGEKGIFIRRNRSKATDQKQG